MAQREPSDETLMAYADGALSGAEAARVAALLDADAEAAAKVAAFRESRERLRAAAAAQADVPAELRTRVEAMLAAHANRAAVASVTPQAWHRPARAVPLRHVALAASLALALGLAGGWWARKPDAPTHDSGLLDLARLAPALDSVPSGRSASHDGSEITLVASFRDSTGTLCREAEIVRPTGPQMLLVACRAADGGWQPQLALSTSFEGGYAPAGGADTLQAFLDSIGAGPPLGREEEAAALAEQ